MSRPGDARPAVGAALPMPGFDGSWQRLHPLSPLIRAGRGAIAFVMVLVIPRLGGGGGTRTGDLVQAGVLLLGLAVGVISWLVTRWRVDGGVLRVESGLIRRISERFPLSQIQAIDTVRPGLARAFGVAELRIQLAAGSGRAGRLAYLSDAEAVSLRARLLALSHGLAQETPQPPERPLMTVPTGRLLISMLLSGGGLLLAAAIVALIALAALVPGASGAIVSGGVAPLIALVVGVFRRFNGEYRLTVAEAPDGLRLRSGLVQTSAETIPRGRIQAVRMIEPLAWRPLDWCRLEVDVASQKARGRQDRNQAKAGRVLLAVGTHEQAAFLLGRVFPDLPGERSPPPARARWKSPLRFHFLGCAFDDRHAVTTSGRLRRVTDWVPLDKVQSVRWAQGPIQRRLSLASIHLDTAGRKVHAVVRDRDCAEATRLIAELPDRCRRARHATLRPMNRLRPAPLLESEKPSDS